MPKFNIPVLFNVKAKSREEAEYHVDRLIGEGFLALQDCGSGSFDAIVEWDFAEIRWRNGDK